MAMKHSHDRDSCCVAGVQRGFSLIELLVAVAIGASLVTAVVAAIHVFSEQLEDVREQQDVALEETLTTILETVRQAWLVELPSATEVRVSDPFGNETTFLLDGTDLEVTRPSGATGTLLSGVTSVSFDIETTQRLRNIAPFATYGPVWSSSVPAGTPVSLDVRDGQALAIGFKVPASAPSGFHPVEGVTEEFVQVILDRLVLPFAVSDACACRKRCPTVDGDDSTIYVGLDRSVLAPLRLRVNRRAVMRVLKRLSGRTIAQAVGVATGVKLSYAARR